MKHLLIIFVFIASSAAAQQVRYIPVKNDRNVIAVPGAETLNGIGETLYIIDADASMGYVIMHFADLPANNTASSVTLILNSPDVEWSDTPEGYSVYSGTTKLGSITSVGRNKSIEINLDAKFFAGKDSITLTLKANGNDGGYIQSNITGFGPVLKMVM